MRGFFGFVGIAMFLGFGALAADAFLDLRAFPAEPRPMTVAEAAALESPGRGAWVTLTDLRFPCAHEGQHADSGGDVYRLGFGERGDARVIVSASELPCSDAPRPMVGVLNVRTAGAGPTGLAFPGFPFDAWPTRWETHLWTDGGPSDSRGLVILLVPFALLGLVLAMAYWKPEEPVYHAEPETSVSPEGLAPWRAEERVLPRGELPLASSSLYDRVLTTVALLDFVAIFGALAFACVPERGWLGWLGVAFFGALGALLLFGLFRIALGWVRERGPGVERVETLVKLVEVNASLANGVDVGNREYVYAHPVSGARVAVVVGFQEPPPLLVNAHLFLVHDGKGGPATLVRAGFAPYALSKDERREARERLVRFAAATFATASSAPSGAPR